MAFSSSKIGNTILTSLSGFLMTFASLYIVLHAKWIWRVSKLVLAVLGVKTKHQGFVFLCCAHLKLYIYMYVERSKNCKLRQDPFQGENQS